ncbi:MAG: DUF1015 family protein [Bacteroidales bacterium]|jgi:uncharacterized protein (DUF1015 family)|nr:DUF1015 family protein [Bacteroidales bacterium]
MSVLKPFKGYRPPVDHVKEVASRPYDVLNSDEARVEVEGNPHSFLHVVKPEVDLDEGIDLHSDIVYKTAKNNLTSLINDGFFVQDSKDRFYVYAQTMFGITQYGIVGCASVEDYMNEVIKKHELTRPDKEEDRMNHIRVANFNAEPVFFAYPDHAGIDAIVAKAIKNDPVYDFETDDDVGHHFWLVDDDQDIADISRFFKEDIPFTYVADGHHRTAAAALVGNERKKNNPDHTGNEEYNFFLAVCFPESQLTIIDYNRVVADLNDLTTKQFLGALDIGFEVKQIGKEIYKPEDPHTFSMYLEGNWFSLKAKPETYNDDDPIGCLDVTILSEQVLSPVLDIKDLRKSTRIDFIGGIRGLEELRKLVDQGKMEVAFALYPVSMKQLMDIADNGLIMPPKTTWFEPKLRSGIVIHSLD